VLFVGISIDPGKSVELARYPQTMQTEERAAIQGCFYEGSYGSNNATILVRGRLVPFWCADHRHNAATY